MNKVILDVINPLYVLNQMNILATAAAAYSLRKMQRQWYKSIRIRDDTLGETDIGFIGENLDTAGMLAWLRRNLVADALLGVDVDSSGISDNWTVVTGSGITLISSIEDGAQKLQITASASLDSSYLNKAVSCVPGNSLDLSLVNYKVSGNVTARIWISWYTSGGVFISTSTIVDGTSTTYAPLSNTNLVAPATAYQARLRIGIKPASSGGTGSAYFKDASVTISNQSAYVTTWYDQSGNGNHAVQSTAANQPRIVNSGVVDVDAAGRPTCVFDGSNDCLRITDNATLQLTTQLSINAKFKSGTANGYIFSRNGSSGAENQYALYYFKDGAILTLYMNGNTDRDTNDIATSTEYISSAIWSGSNADIFVNGNSNGSGAYSTPLTNRTNTQIGCRSSAADGSTQATFFNGNISELIILNAALTNAQRQRLERNQNAYYKVY